MGKPLSRPDCLRQNPTCLGKGEEEDGYIEDCYVPQRSIYDTMRINEQIDQGSKLNQTSKSTMEKMEGSTISSNGTLGAASNVFEPRAPEGKKLDERIIFDALKLSSDMQKSAPVPPRRRPNAERKDNVNRRSWKSFMPPNFPEFAERMEVSLSEVSEAGASNPSLQEKRGSSSVLTESSGHLDHREPQSKSVTLERVSKSIGIPEVQDVKNLSEDCQDLRFQQHSESSPNEFQPLESEAAVASGHTDVMQEHRFSSATWPRAMKSLAKRGFSEQQHPLGDAAFTVEIPLLSPCLSEELLDPELRILITPSLREKTESELKFEEDERWIMMEAEEEWEEEKLSERGKTFLMVDEKKNNLAHIFEEREQANPVAVVEEGADCSPAVLGTFDCLALGQICCSGDSQPAKDHFASLPKDTPLDCICVLTDVDAAGEMRNRNAQGLGGLVSDLECIVGSVNAEQLSDTDSVQMFLELEKECLCEEEITPLVDLKNPVSFEGLAPSQDAENSLVTSHFPETALEKEQHVDLLNLERKDYDIGLDCECFNALVFSQVPNTVELIAHPDITRDTSTVSKEECEKVPFSPKTTGEFKFRHPVDLESLGELDPEGLPNSYHRASHEENVSGFIASELAKENGSLSQVDCSPIEGSVEDCVERVPLSSPFDCELDVTSGPEVEVLPYDSHLLTGEIHLESEKGAINQENNSLTSLVNMDPCEFLSMDSEQVCDEDGKLKELDYEAKLLESRSPAYFHRDFPEQVSLTVGRKSSESESLSLHLLVGRDGMKTVNNIKPKLNMASSEGGEMETRGSDSLLNIFPEEQVTRANNIVSILEEGVPIPQRPVPTATVTTVEEDVLDAAVPAPEGPAASAAMVSAPEGAAAAVIVPSPEETASVATIADQVPAASVAILEEDVPAPAVPAPKGADASPAVPASGEDVLAASVVTIEEHASDTPVPAPEGAVAAAAVPAQEEDVPAASGVMIEEMIPAASVATIEVHVPAASVVTMEEVCAPEGAALALTMPAPEGAAPVAAVPAPEGTAPAVAVPTTEEDSTPEEPPTPAAAVFTPEEPATPAAAVHTPEESAAPAVGVPTPEGRAIPPAVGVPTPEGDAAPAATVPAIEEVFPTGVPFLGDIHADSVPISKEGTPVLEKDLDPSAFGIKEVTGTVLHGDVPLAAVYGLSSHEVMIVHFVVGVGKVWRRKRFASSLTW
ncbi:uncharacterized protein KIAA0754 homolog [Choloepus didactylus]|uniref:uncharacterized protein KIAA0754 homolog n=1 Tax=Choloepus didactylus TaxID=27675 RepID=UPI00189EF567|nr:uncharacterized protein KIAA0754 homolog [Choloepus didactylus]